jgi:OOP family OmpA-OmpF porin
VILAGILITASIASAANRAGDFSVSPVIGGYTFDDPQSIGQDSNIIVGGRIGYNFTRHIGFEGLFDYVHDDYSFPHVEMYRYGGELLVHLFPDHDFVPYVAAGVGGVNFSGGRQDKRAHFSYDAGVGAKYFLLDNFALRGDFRAVFYDSSGHSYSNLEYTLGAYIPFGGARSSVKPLPEPVEPPVIPVQKVVEAPVASLSPPLHAPSVTLTISPETVVKGQSITLSWKSQNASTCTIQPEIGQVPPLGTRKSVPVTSTIYIITCSGLDGTAGSSAEIIVTQPSSPQIDEQKKPTVSEASNRSTSNPTVISINFDTDKSNIKPQYKAVLQDAGEQLKKSPEANGLISGHTDNRGSKAYNQKLSQRRAASAKKYIVRKTGISPHRIKVKGYGYTKPIASNKTRKGRSENRRVEVQIPAQ